ncbi:MAG TPA: S41 family peptidase [Terriglobales bacterium]|nr:S41 family peptidase [Terriglobales bacterium]
MWKLAFALVFVVCAVNIRAQDQKQPPALSQILGFEIEPKGSVPGGWYGTPPETISADATIVHGGRWSAHIDRNATSTNDFSTLTNSIPVNFSGNTIKLSGFIRTEDVSGFVGLWLREDGESPALQFDNMQKRQVKGTTPWTQYTISLPLDPEAKNLVFGFLQTGTGKSWVDDLALLVDGKPVDMVPKVEKPKTIFDQDHQFDHGSSISLTSLTELQIESLVTLGKVWGVLKYHHPKVTSGQLHWDYELFRIMPEILAAKNRSSANAILVKWIDRLGPITACSRCAKLKESDLNLRPDLVWTENKVMLGDDLSQHLRAIYAARSADGAQFYVEKAPNIGNPAFTHELSYDNLKFPDAGYQLLALFRYWNIIEYWSPDRDVVGEDWDSVLAEFIPRIALAKSSEAYQLEMMAMIGMAHDGHSNLWSSLKARPPVGECQIEAELRFIGNQPVVSSVPSANSTGVIPGDVITALDDVPVGKLVEKWIPYYAASNDAARMRDIAHYMTRGECGESKVRVQRDGAPITLTVKKVPFTRDDYSLGTHDLPGPTFQRLSKDVAYLKLSTVKIADAEHYVHDAAGTKGLIIDIRNYPSEFVVYALGSLLTKRDVPFARVTILDLANPGAFYWAPPETLPAHSPHYGGKIAVLVDELSMSQSEFTAMAYRACGAIIVGSTTSGADGNISPFVLPGGLRTMISGLGVYYPDHLPTQRIGIIPDIEVKPTVAGIRAERDEVLEEALRQILGKTTSNAELEKLYRKPVIH